LAGLPPGFAGLFAKITVVKVLLGGHWTWLAVVVALNAVLALAYYARVGMVLFARSVESQAVESQVKAEGRVRVPWPIAVGLAGVTGAALVIGFVPQWALSAAGF
jgi:NADH-quinone oxidoreductase subunit N